jgi:hypothetical protein
MTLAKTAKIAKVGNDSVEDMILLGVLGALGERIFSRPEVGGQAKA